MGKRGTFSDKILRKSALFLSKEGARFTSKLHLLLRKGAPFGCLNFWEQAPLPPPPPDSTARALDCGPSGAMRNLIH